MSSCGKNYKTFEHDPAKVRMYTLDNGLTVYLSKNQDEPKIQTYIAVRAGSVYDPKDNTGLAHYLEHMLFKGTSHFGTMDWEKEKPLLDKIADLYEKHKATEDEDTKIEIYRQIDSISGEAANYAIANEYDQMIASLGGQKTNAHTWFEETVYKNLIPTNGLEKWLKIESERFSELVLRLFHTELEAVYEEFNGSQDSDSREQFQRLLAGLFPTHPYGQQTTIGTSEHLRNPSMKAIHAYFNKYYVPNNMALVLVGDIDFDATIQMVERYFGKLKKKEVVHPTLPTEKPLSTIVRSVVTGPTPASVMLGFRTKGVGTKGELYAKVVQELLYNGRAGIMDIELNQKQQLQASQAFYIAQNDYGMHILFGMPRNNQTLDQVRDLLLAQIDKIKKGDFKESVLQAIINNLQLAEVKRFESANGVAEEIYEAYIHFQPWQDRVGFLDKLSKVTKQDIIDFANATYLDNYAIVYKEMGKNDFAVKVPKPTITPVKLTKEKTSAFNERLSSMPTEEIKPLFIDYKSEIQEIDVTDKVQMSFVKNKNNDLYTLSYIFDVGSDHIKELSVAIDYFDLLGTSKYSPEEIKQEFYNLATDVNVRAYDRKTVISLSGLYGENFEKAAKLLEHYIDEVKVDKNIYAELVQRIIKDRIDEKNDKQQIIFGGLLNLGLYGENSPLKDRYTIKELKQLDPSDLVKTITGLKKYKHKVFYYGTHEDEVKSIVAGLHKSPNQFLESPAPKEFSLVEPNGHVYVTNYDIVQSQVLLLTKNGSTKIKNLALIDLFNNYFGSGLSSVVFREIRESQALAYSAMTQYRVARRTDLEDFFFGYLSTQTDKMPQAVDALRALLLKMPESEEFFQSAKQSSIKKIESERITKANIYYSYQRLQDRGLDYDIRKDIYASLQKLTLADLVNFFEKEIKGKEYNFAVMGNVEQLNMDALKKLGKVEVIDVDYLFDHK